MNFLETYIYKNLAVILASACIILTICIGVQDYTIRSLESDITRLKINLTLCGDKVKSLTRVNNRTFESFKHDRQYEKEILEKCRSLIEKTDKPITKQEIEKLLD